MMMIDDDDVLYFVLSVCVAFPLILIVGEGKLGKGEQAHWAGLT